jgi:internalin A
MTHDHLGLGIARERIAEETRARTGSLDLGMLGLDELPADLFVLTHLRRLNLGDSYFDEEGSRVEAASDIAPNRLDAQLSRLVALPDLDALSVSGAKLTTLTGIAQFGELQSLDCSWTQVSDLSPLSGLSALQSLTCSGTHVSDLSPLSGLSALQSLYCFETKVSDLSPLSGLRELQSVTCSESQVSDLSPLSGLSALQSLTCSGTQVSDLSPLIRLSTLQSLDCSETRVSDLSPLSGLSALQWLNCWGTQVGDLSPLSGLSALQSLYCSETQVSDLSPLSSLSALQSLDCSRTQVSDLSPLSGLSALQWLNCSRCILAANPEDLWLKPSLNHLYLFETQVPGIPAEVLSQGNFENCLESLRAHLGDLRAGAVAVPDVKLIVLGNGRVGKTQICRRLRSEDYDPRVPSTHGVIVTSARLPASDGVEPAVLHIWDFGGQDIYHGTHALFMRTRAAFLIIWTPEVESSAEQVWEGMVFRNHPLPYWIDTVRHLGVTGSPVLIVQTRCDRLEDDVHRLPAPPELLAALPHWELQYSALNNRKRAALDEALHEAVERVRGLEREITIGAGRLKVKQRLEQLRDDDASVPPEQRQYRTVTQEHFRQLCDKAGGVRAPEHLLSYLHNAGVVFYQKGLFDDRIRSGLGARSHLRRVQSGKLLSAAATSAWPLYARNSRSPRVAGVHHRRTGSLPRHDAILRYLLRASPGDGRCEGIRRIRRARPVAGTHRNPSGTRRDVG